jgi:glutamyl-tRNA synthetase
MDKQVRVRFAPSPTGYLHIGGARTALFNWLFARHNGGKFILRIEDTDKERSTDESIKAILDSMKWLELDWDEGPFYQTQRYDLYRQMCFKLLEECKAYKCYCTQQELEAKRELASKEKRKPKYDGTCRELTSEKPLPYAIRFKTPQTGETRMFDHLRGEVVFNNEELDDLIILRSDGAPTYNFTVVVDDHEMGITHVIRGDDHLNNTPKQVLFYKALGWEVPEFIHVPLILGNDKKRLSKRHGAMSVMAYHDMGFLSIAVVNYLVRLGWSSEDQELFTREDLIAKFSLDGLGKSAGVFNVDKMTWVSGQHMKMSNPEVIARQAIPFLKAIGIETVIDDKLLYLVKACQERSKTLIELADWMKFYYFEKIEYDEKDAKKFLTKDAKPILELLRDGISIIGELSESSIEALFKDVSEKLNIKLMIAAQTARMALTGKTVSPGIYDVVFILGKERVIKRFEDAISFIKGNSV